MAILSVHLTVSPRLRCSPVYIRKKHFFKKKGRVADQTNSCICLYTLGNKFFTDHCIAVEVIAHLKNSV